MSDIQPNQGQGVVKPHPGYRCAVCKNINPTNVLACDKCGTVPENTSIDGVPDLRPESSSGGTGRIIMGVILILLGIGASVASSTHIYYGAILVGVIWIIRGASA